MAPVSSGTSSSQAHACAHWDIPDKQKHAETAGVGFEARGIDVRGLLYVYRHEGNTSLTNTLTLEQQLLDAPDWLLEVDTFADWEDAALVRVFGDDDREVRDVGGVLRHRAVERLDACEWLVVEKDGKQEKWWSLDSEAVKHRVAVVNLKVGVAAVVHPLASFVFGRPRLAKQKHYGPASDVYSFLCSQKTSTPFVGLVAFQFQEKRDLWLDWRRWRWLSRGMDIGADGAAALFGAQYLFSLNVEGFPDPSHGATNDVVSATTQLSLTSLWLLGLVS